MDEDVHLGLSSALRKRGYDATHVREVQRRGLEDAEQLEYAVKTGRCFLTFNVGDFVRLHVAYLEAGRSHFGIIASKQLPLGSCLRSLLLLLQSHSAETMQGSLEFL